MRICLIYPTFDNWEAWPPLTLACLASFLEQYGHKVTIIDRNILLANHVIFSRTNRAMSIILKQIDPGLIGLTATTPLVQDAYCSARLARQVLPEARIILGGIHASIMPGECLQECEELDMVCVGEGEFLLKQLAEGEDIDGINGLYYRIGDKIKSNPRRKMHPRIDDFPIPARHLLEMNRYLRPTSLVIRGLELRSTHLFTGIGCIANCHFCAWPGLYGRHMRLHSADYIFHEIKRLVDEYNVVGLYLAEEMFFSNKIRFYKLCRMLIDSGYNRRVKLCVNLRTDVIDRERLALLRKAGFVQVEYGIESGSQRMLDIMNKGTSVDDNRRAIALSREVGLRVLGNIIIGTPGERIKDVRQTIEFLDDTRPDHVSVNRFVPFPGSHFFNELKKQGKISKNWKSYWCADIDTNYSDIADKEFVKLFLGMRLKYHLRNGFNAICWNMHMKPSYIFKYPYYLMRDPVRFLWRRAFARR
jgi:anaerobic magnesium-protoporphyrin IX monomethyl ester cyclase